MGVLRRAEEVDPKAEEVFRFNNQAYTDRDRFPLALGSVSGKRLTSDELTRSYEACYNKVLPKAVIS